MLGRLSRILVVDGCAASRSVTHRYLQTLGYQLIDYAPDGRTALRMIGQNNYRLVFADWDVEQLNGLELLKQTRSDQRLRCLPFLMAIPRWQKKFIEIVRDDGATLYLTKPFTMEILNERMIQVYGDASRLKQAQAQMRQTDPLVVARNTGIPTLWQHLRPNP